LAHYILKYSGNQAPKADLDRIDRTPGITILDRAANRAMLVDASPATAQALDGQLPDWTVAKEVTYPLPGLAMPTNRTEKD
jgi:hypothetical protein